MQSDDNTDVRLIGTSAAIRAIQADIDTAARSDAKVLITGETGVGKEVVAHLIHQRSARRHKPMVTLNCAGVPESLLESELFGHVRGSFTGAHKDRRGLLEMAANGTMFLDEVGEMSLRMQAVLLRFLQSGEIQRVGADTRSHTGERPPDISDKPRPQGADGRRRVPRGLLFQAQRRRHPRPAAAPTARKTSRCWPFTSSRNCGRQHRVSTELSPEILDILCSIPLAG